jgi:hypothetical protein
LKKIFSEKIRQGKLKPVTVTLAESTCRAIIVKGFAHPPGLGCKESIL